MKVADGWCGPRSSLQPFSGTMAIHFIDYKATQGYQFRVGPRHALLTKFFAVRKHGGKYKALVLARAAEVDAEPTTSKAGPRLRPAINNASGVVGIRPRYMLHLNQLSLCLVASWCAQGKSRSTSYSAERHRKLEALPLAMACRERGTGMKFEITPRQAFSRMKYLLTGDE